MTTIYHNPRCSKSRQTLALLEDNGVKPEVVLYLDQHLDKATLKSLITKLELNGPRDIIRKGEEAYKEMKLSDKTLSDGALINAIIQVPKLLERPIVVKGNKAVIGRPPENVLSLL
ncbi:MAG: arsenate reductase [Cellvibrionaceae bacterium]|jgi:arsenate reductase